MKNNIPQPRPSGPPDGLLEALAREVAPLGLEPSLRSVLVEAASLPPEDRLSIEVFLQAATAGVRAQYEVPV